MRDIAGSILSSQFNYPEVLCDPAVQRVRRSSREDGPIHNASSLYARAVCTTCCRPAQHMQKRTHRYINSESQLLDSAGLMKPQFFVNYEYKCFFFLVFVQTGVVVTLGVVFYMYYRDTSYRNRIFRCFPQCSHWKV
jgi:hypothetical protein